MMDVALWDWLCERVEFEPNSGCWLWMRSLTNGYAQATLGRKHERKHWGVHCLTYEAVNGPIADGLDIDHKCRVRCCVNPDHLEPVTRSENLRRSPLRYRTNCKVGHEYTPENTGYAKDGARRCRQCDAAWQRAYNVRKRAAR